MKANLKFVLTLRVHDWESEEKRSYHAERFLRALKELFSLISWSEPIAEINEDPEVEEEYP